MIDRSDCGQISTHVARSGTGGSGRQSARSDSAGEAAEVTSVEGLTVNVAPVNK